MHQFDNPLVMAEGGKLVEEKWLRLSEILHDMDENFQIRWIPPQHRTSAQSKPYVICYVPPVGKAYVVMFAGELDDPVDILARLWEGDNSKGDVLQKIRAKELAQEAFDLSEKMAREEELADQTHFMITNRSGWFVKHKTADGTIVKIDTQNGRRVS